MEAYCFAIAFAGRLESGDLFGGVTELSSEEMEKEFGIKTEQSSVNESDLGMPVAGSDSSEGSEKIDSDSLGIDPSILGD